MDEVSDSVGDHSGFARPGSGDDHKGATAVGGGFILVGIEGGEIKLGVGHALLYHYLRFLILGVGIMGTVFGIARL